jgi:hypothetical protein
MPLTDYKEKVAGVNITGMQQRLQDQVEVIIRASLTGDNQLYV